MKTVVNAEFKFPFNVDEFRNDIINNVVFKELNKKYNIKTRIELDGYLHRLSKLDKKIYEYKHSEVIRGLQVYESKDGFIKISRREVNKIKSTLKCENIECSKLDFDGKSKITFEIKVA